MPFLLHDIVSSNLTVNVCAVSGQYMIQQNFGNSTDFFRRSWAEYKIGFGDPSGNYWIGNAVLYNLTSVFCACSANFYALNTAGIWYIRSYKKLFVGDETTGYKLTTQGPGGNGNDSLNHH